MCYLKKLFFINDATDLFQKLWKLGVWIVTILTSSTILGILTFFKSQLGVAITCGTLFAIVCFIALFIVIALKNNAVKTINQHEFNLKNSVVKLSNKDLEFILNGKFINGSSHFIYNIPIAGNKYGEHYRGWTCTVSASIFFKLTKIFAFAPSNSCATTRFQFRCSDPNIDTSKFIIRIYDSKGVESILSGSANEKDILLSERSDFSYRIEHPNQDVLVNKDISVLSLVIITIGWKIL
ncbi:MAG: hypothetical protein FJ368_05745 [Pelagibacterales bacterium]|nr:hypothetical protein [Pelagibacterales bacterium]